MKSQSNTSSPHLKLHTSTKTQGFLQQFIQLLLQLLQLIFKILGISFPITTPPCPPPVSGGPSSSPSVTGHVPTSVVSPTSTITGTIPTGSHPHPSIIPTPTIFGVSPSPVTSPTQTTSTPPPSNCTPSAILVNPCRPWLGASVGGYPNVGSDIKSQLLAHEKRIGKQLDIVHTYHGVGNNQLSSDDIYFATRANTYLYANWKPAGKWASISSNNAGIDSMATSIKSIAPKKLFLTIHHEPENDVTSDSNCPGVGYKGSSGTPTDYRNMWAYVENRFKADGVTNVVWVMNYMGYKPWDCLVPDLWPGNGLVDWLTIDSYSSGDSSTWDNTVGRFYNVLVNDNNATTNFESKPWGAGEWGDCEVTDQAHVYQYYAEVKNALDANTYPRLKMFMIYDNSGNNAGMGCLTGYSKAGTPDPTEQAHYNNFVNDPLFNQK